MSCEHAAQVEAYHDRRLTAQSRVEVEAHLSTCGECAALLADLRGLSMAIKSAPMTPIPADVLARLREGLHAATERSILHIAGWLTSAAAAILVGALLIMPSQSSNPTMMASASPTWQIDAVSPPSAEQADGSGATDVVSAEWMTDEFRLPDASR